MLLALSETVGGWIVIGVLSSGVIWMVASARAKDRAERRIRLMEGTTRIAANRAKQRDRDALLETAIDDPYTDHMDPMLEHNRREAILDRMSEHAEEAGLDND